MNTFLKYHITILILMILTACQSQFHLTETINNEVEIDGEHMLIGGIDRSAFEMEPYSVWFFDSYEGYVLDQELLDQIEEFTDDIEIKLVLGTWCSDSQREVPVFCKILDSIEFNYSDIEIIATDRSKKIPAEDLMNCDIEFVPTIIFYRNKIEIGRIVESPAESLEQDLLDILTPH